MTRQPPTPNCLGMKRYLIWLPLVLAIFGCATPARRLDATVVEQLHEGTATQSDVERILGRPLGLETGANGKTVAVYEFARLNEGFAGPREFKARQFSVLYDSNFVMERKLLSASATPYRAGWKNRLGRPMNRAEIVRTMRPQIPRTELIEKFGPPSIETLTIDGGTVAGWVALEQESAYWGGIRQQILEVVFDESGLTRTYKIVGTLDRPTK